MSYTIITTISHFRNKYVVPTECLSEYNSTQEFIDKNDLNTFSSYLISNDVVHHDKITIKQALEQFDVENPEFASWSVPNKLSWIKSWQD
jgi:hypothetical protein